MSARRPRDLDSGFSRHSGLRHRLTRAAREALFARGCLIPRGRDIDDGVRRAIQLVDFADRQRLDAAVAIGVREAWLPRLPREITPGENPGRNSGASCPQHQRLSRYSPGKTVEILTVPVKLIPAGPV